MFNALFLCDVAINDEESIMMRREGILPFVPFEKLMLKVGPEDNFREVKLVYFSTCDSPQIEVFMDDEQELSVKKMAELGWEIGE